MKKNRCRYANWLCSVASALLVLLMLSSISHASDVRHLWQSRDQFVALDSKDSPRGGAAISNDHPIDLSRERLTAILASIEVRTEDGGKPEQLLTSQSLEALVPQMVQGFRQAAPEEDVTFAIIGLYKALHGFTKSPKVTTGRAFYKGGRLNIIFGLVQKDVNEREERRLAPFTPGRRQKAAEGEWTLLPQTGQNGFDMFRKDWVTFSDEWRAPVAQTPIAVKIVPLVETTPSQSEKRVNDTSRPADRLTTLNELKEKGLITEEEYRFKRLEIMNGL
jgi:hypothetical protein